MITVCVSPQQELTGVLFFLVPAPMSVMGVAFQHPWDVFDVFYFPLFALIHGVLNRFSFPRIEDDAGHAMQSTSRVVSRPALSFSRAAGRVTLVAHVVALALFQVPPDVPGLNLHTLWFRRGSPWGCGSPPHRFLSGEVECLFCLASSLRFHSKQILQQVAVFPRPPSISSSF